MKEKPNHIKSILTVMAIAFAVVFFITASQTSALAVQPMVAAGCFHTVGLKSDGTVVAAGGDGSGECDVSSWTKIVQVASSDAATVGVKSDGTVVAVGWNIEGRLNVDSWTGIVQVATTWGHTVGLKSDGTVVAEGRNLEGQCNVGSWTGIVQVSAFGGYTVGLKSDGTVVAVGNNGNGQCNVSDWDLIKELVYTPVTPCRIVDTRLSGGAIPPGGIRSYNVWGDVASQGGNSSGCPSPKGEPYTAHINVTVVPSGNGNIVAYPFGSTAPLASLVNYRADAQNIANSGTVKTCFNCGKDINIKSRVGTAHVIIDVLGYDFAKP
jgi:Regulator of Chromosome Condensation (RCC1) repeat protein